jgi:hypothetical protein
MELLTLTYEHVFSVRDSGAADRARRLLPIAHELVETLSASVADLLAKVARFSRMLSAITPPPPLMPHTVRTRPVANLAFVGLILRRLLVTGLEQFRLYVFILGRALATLTGFLRDATRRIVTDEPSAPRDWKHVEDGVADLQTLTGHAMDSLRAVLTALDREVAEDAWSVDADDGGSQREGVDPATVALWMGLVIVLLAALHGLTRSGGLD